MVTLHEGAIFAGRYRVVRPIAAGGMGAVYEVVHLDTQRRRALKVMLPHVLQNEELRDRFKREARVAADVESEFIVDVFDAGVDDATGMPFLVMELLRGEELGKRLKRAGPLPPAEAIGYLHQTALALDKTHRASVVHRDLKPENIFLTTREDGPPRVKVLDFGVAKLVAEGASAAGATEVVGTPTYMAPEQFIAHGSVSPAADIYALGLMAYTMLVGTAYWKDEAMSGNSFAVALVASRGPSEAASARAARRGVTLPPAFDGWFATATAVDPRRRFPSASVAVRALADAFGVPLPAAQVDPPSLRDAADPLLLPTGPQASVPLPSLALPAVTATLAHTEPMQARRTGLTIVGVVLGSLIGIIAGVWAWHSRSSAHRASAEGSSAPAATSASADAPAKPVPPADTASPGAPSPVPSAAPPTVASAEPEAQQGGKPRPAPSAKPSAIMPPPVKTPPVKPSPGKPSPVYSQE